MLSEHGDLEGQLLAQHLVLLVQLHRSAERAGAIVLQPEDLVVSDVEALRVDAVEEEEGQDETLELLVVRFSVGFQRDSLVARMREREGELSQQEVLVPVEHGESRLHVTDRAREVLDRREPEVDLLDLCEGCDLADELIVDVLGLFAQLVLRRGVIQQRDQHCVETGVKSHNVREVPDEDNVFLYRDSVREVAQRELELEQLVPELEPVRDLPDSRFELVVLRKYEGIQRHSPNGKRERRQTLLLLKFREKRLQCLVRLLLDKDCNVDRESEASHLDLAQDNEQRIEQSSEEFQQRLLACRLLIICRKKKRGY